VRKVHRESRQATIADGIGVKSPGALFDGEGQMHRIYGEGLILIRPDGYLGYTGPSDGPGLRRYLQRYFG